MTMSFIRAAGRGQTGMRHILRQMRRGVPNAAQLPFKDAAFCAIALLLQT
jgi:hypothetical protein